MAIIITNIPNLIKRFYLCTFIKIFLKIINFLTKKFELIIMKILLFIIFVTVKCDRFEQLLQ